MTEQMDGQMTLFDPAIWCGKTCREPLAATKERTSVSSSKKRQKSQTPKFLYLDLRKNGLTQEPLWETDSLSLGGSSMLNFSECPSVVVESHLSQILEARPHPKYSLSPKECLGCLRRAERRGKELPPMVKEALMRQAGLSVSKNEPAVQGEAKEYLSKMTAQEHSAPSTTNVCYGISAYESNAMKSSNPHSGVYEADTSRTLDNNGENPACNQGGMAIVQSAGFKGGQSSGGIGYADEQAPTLQATPSALEPTVVCCLNDQGGSVMSTTENITSTLRAQEHGHQPIVYDARENGNGELAPTITGDHQNRVTDYTALCIGNGQADQTGLHEIAGALNCMHDQQAVMIWGLDRAAYNQCKNAKYNFSIEQEKIGAQVAKGPGAIATQSVVRRLTPLECTRLQGYPDRWVDIGDWTDSKGKKHKDADSPKYKALGNSIAIPCWRFILQAISDRCTERTMASLFDGISGFCLIWYELGGDIRFVSEIEEYPIAVCKRHFGDEETGEIGDIERYVKKAGWYCVGECHHEECTVKEYCERYLENYSERG